MSVLPELEQRLAENEGRIAALLQRLEDHAELEESLRVAGSGLKEANVEVKRLAESTKVAIESLTAVLASFQDTVEILRQADPARATEAVARIEERFNTSEQRVRESIDEAAEAVSSGQKRADNLLRAEAQAIRKAIPTVISYITLVVVLALVGFEILRHFPTLLSG